MAIKVRIRSGVTLDVQELPAGVVKELERKTSHKDPKRAMLQRQGFYVRDMPARIRTHYNDGRHLRLWRGCLGLVVKTLRKHRLDYQVVDKRLWLRKVEMPCRVKLRGYQEGPFAKSVKRQQALGRGEAGSGKTELALAVAAHFSRPTLVLVWQERQQRVWLDRVPKYFDFEPGGIGGAFRTPVLGRPITIGMVQSVRNQLERYKRLFGCIICDEVQRFASRTLREVVNAMPAAVRIGASDDERRRDGREFLLYDTFGPTAWTLKRGTGQCPVDVVLVPTGFKYSGLDFSVQEWASLVEELTEDEHRNRIIVNLAKAEVERGHRVLIWSDRVEHCRLLHGEFLADGYRAGLLLGTQQMKAEADRTENGLRKGTVEIGIGTSVAEQSINVQPLDRGIMTCASAGRKINTRFKQMRGRLARPCEGKERATLYYVWDRAVPGLRRKAQNISQAYEFKILRHNYHKEKFEMPGETTTTGGPIAVTLESLKAGCKQLRITVPKGATLMKLERLIDRELSKDPTYGSYSCGACQRDITDRINPCPWCAAKYKPLPDEPKPEEGSDLLDDGEEELGADLEDTEEQEVEEEAEEVEDQGEGEDDGEEDGGEDEGGEDDGGEDEEYFVDEEQKVPAEWEDDGSLANGQEATEDGYPVVYSASGEAYAVEEDGSLTELEATTEAEEDAGEPEEEVISDGWEEPEPEEEPEEPDPPKKQQAKKKQTAKKKELERQKEKERKAKRNQIAAELPYGATQLKQMKRQVLTMIARVLGLPQKVGLGPTDEMIKAILQEEKKRWPNRFKSSKAKPEPKKSKAKATTKKKSTKKRRG